MKQIKNLAFGIFRMLTVCLLFAACADEDGFRQVQEGLPVSLKFQLTTPAPNSVQTRATDQQETRVEKLALFFYRSNDALPFVYNVPEAQLKNYEAVSGTNYLYSIEVPESAGLTSGTYYLYAVANWDKGFWDPNMKLTDLEGLTKAQMDDYRILKTSSNLQITETAILLTGKYGRADGQVTIERKSPTDGTATLADRIHLRRSLAKIKFNFTNGANVTFTPERWEIHEYCRTATLFEREGWTNRGNAVDNVSGTYPGNLEWAGKEGVGIESCFNSGNIPYESANGIEFYMPENIQRAKESGLTDKLMREKKNADGTMKYAPDHGTHIEVYGKYAGPADTDNNPATPDENVTADVKYTIYLGDFSTATGTADNFTVRRNTKYTFNVTVNGVNNIIVEATTDVENQPGAEGDVIHAGNENTKELDAHYATEILAIPVNILTGASQFGLQVTTPKTNSIIDVKTGQEPELAEMDIDWLKFAKPASTTTFVKYPKQGEGLLHLSDVIAQLIKGDYSNFIQQDGKLYIQVFVDEYYYNNLSLDKFVNTDARVITLATSTKTSADGNSSYSDTPVFSIKQSSIKSPYILTNSAVNPLGLENRSDEAATSFLNSAKNDNLAGTDMGDGYANCYGTAGIIPVGAKWSTYVDFANNTMQADYNYGAYQWLSRNRDENGDDIIDAEEIKWYLPSINQHNCIWIGKLALNSEAQLNEHHVYFTSTSGQYRTYWAKEGAFGAYKPGNDYEDDQRVRCIRALKQPMEATTKVSNYNTGTRTITVTALDGNALRESGTQRGEYIAHTQDNINNRAPQAFQIAKVVQSGGLTIDAKPGDTYVPKVTTSNISSNPADYGFSSNHTMTFTLTVNKVDGHKYYWGKNVNGTDKQEITEGNVTLTTTFTSSWWNFSSGTPVYIFADNGNYVTLTPTAATTIGQTETIIDANKPGSPKSTFTASEILSGDWCKDYFEETDRSDIGQWRIPNQRELLLMKANEENGGYKLPDYTAARTWYDGRSGATEENGKGIFFVQGGGGFITSDQENYTYSFKIIPVRDAQPEQTSSSINVGSSYGSGGSIIK